MENQNEENVQEEQDMTQKDDKRFLKGALTGALVTLVVVILAGAGLYIGLFRGGLIANKKVVTSATETKLNLIRSVIGHYFLYDVDDEDLENGIYQGYVDALDDPYSVYYDEEAAKGYLEDTTGEYSGVGAVLTQDESSHYLVVLEVYKDSPADKAGLLEGDILYQVDDRKIKDEDMTEIISWVRGEEGTDVVLHVYRGEEMEEVELTATRENLETKTVSYEMKDNNIGYIRVSKFEQVTYEQFKAALEDLKAQGMQGLVIDLRSNPGGDVDNTCDMLRLLLPKGTIVYTEDKNGDRYDYTCDADSGFDTPLAVLVNENSASASEIFSGAIQDYGVGTIVGMTTYGKGVMQTTLNLQDGTYLKLTTAEYFSPKGKTIQGHGVTPDVEVQYEADEANPDADNQLDKAVEVVTEQMSQTEE